ncbi:hypothetical protein BPY_10840 [Bifidobacterium psychraerophilum]
MIAGTFTQSRTTAFWKSMIIRALSHVMTLMVIGPEAISVPAVDSACVEPPGGRLHLVPLKHLCKVA